MGIPYNERVKLNTKNFIGTVYNTDKNQIKEITRKEELINDDDKPEKEKGEIYKIVNNPETDKKQKQLKHQEKMQEEQKAQ